MKNSSISKKRTPDNVQNLTRDIVIAYTILFALLMTLPGKALYADLHSTIPQERKTNHFPTLLGVGRGELTWFGISIYEASLWTANGKFTSLTDALPVAFTITYARNITSSALAERTVEEWERLDIFDINKRNYWGNKLKQIWPDVKPGDSITTLVTTDRKTIFYHNEKLLHVLDEPAFGTSLLSIWLHANTSEPGLREKLIGKKEDNHD